MHRTERQLSGPGAALALATLSIALQVAASLHAAEWPQVRVFTSAALRAVFATSNLSRVLAAACPDCAVVMFTGTGDEMTTIEFDEGRSGRLRRQAGSPSAAIAAVAPFQVKVGTTKPGTTSDLTATSNCSRSPASLTSAPG